MKADEKEEEGRKDRSRLRNELLNENESLSLSLSLPDRVFWKDILHIGKLFGPLSATLCRSRLEFFSLLYYEGRKSAFLPAGAPAMQK